MDEQVLRITMTIAAVATPILALALFGARRATGRESGEPLGARDQRNLWLLGLAGPANLLLWLALNGWLEFRGARSVAGYAIAALAFIGFGFATGLFGRLAARRRADRAMSAQNGED